LVKVQLDPVIPEVFNMSHTPYLLRVGIPFKDLHQLLYNFSIFLGTLLTALAHLMLEGRIIIIKIKLKVSLFDTLLFTK
jgi:hypothetical protein